MDINRHLPGDTDRILTEKLGAAVVAQGLAEVEGCIPPWVREGGVKIDYDGVVALMLTAWARGWSARREAMS